MHSILLQYHAINLYQRFVMIQGLITIVDLCFKAFCIPSSHCFLFHVGLGFDSDRKQKKMDCYDGLSRWSTEKG